MILTEEQEVIDLIGQASRTGNSSTAKVNLRHATSQIENHLGTPLARIERIDYFGCPTNINPGVGRVPQAVLNLTAGFVDLAQTFEVFYSDTGEPIIVTTDDHSALQDGTAYSLDEKLGRLHLFGLDDYPIPADAFRVIAVHYTAGFSVNDNDIAEGVPLALRSGAATIAANLMKTHSATPNKNTPVEEQHSALRRSGTGMLSAYIRPRATGDEPQSVEII